jgi:hypothetical protein
MHSIADARCLGRTAFALLHTDLHTFAAEILQTVENDREKSAPDVFLEFSGRLS